MGMLDGKTALVTGAGRGIGRGIAIALAHAGAKVVVNDLGASLAGDGTSADRPTRSWTRSRRRAASPRPTTARWPTSARPRPWWSRPSKAWGRIDILVNVAGILRDRMIFNMTEAEWDAVIAVHLKGTFNTSRAASVAMREQKGGRIISMSSVSALGAPGPAQLRRRQGRHHRLHVVHRQRAREVRRDGQRHHAERRHADDRLDAPRPRGVRADGEVAERAGGRAPSAIPTTWPRSSSTSRATRPRTSTARSSTPSATATRSWRSRRRSAASRRIAGSIPRSWRSCSPRRSAPISRCRPAPTFGRTLAERPAGEWTDLGGGRRFWQWPREER